MAQSKVTEYFSNRKKTFDVIQPSKKLKLDVQREVNVKSNFKSPETIKELCTPVSTNKRKAKRKQMTNSKGNIKSFLESAGHKQCKLSFEHTVNDKTDSVVWQKGIKTLPQSNVNCDSSLRAACPEKVSLNFSSNEESTPLLKLVNKRETSSTIKSNIRAALEMAAHRQLPTSSSVQNKSDTVEVLQKETPSCRTGRNSFFEKPSVDMTPMGINRKPHLNGSGNATEELPTRKDKQQSLREKIKLFKEAACKLKVPEKPDIKETPAYQRLSVSQKEVTSSLVLPFKYKVLFEMFRSTETIVSMLYNRKELVTFDKLEESVQQLTKRAFDRKLLGQIATVFPDAYKFNVEKPVGYLASGKTKGNVLQLVITPVVRTKAGEISEKLNPTILLERREKFHLNLVEITKKHHQSFLAHLKPPIIMSSEDIMRWHPQFLDSDVPDIPEFPLPEATERKIATAKDVLEKMNGIVCARIEKALQSVANETPMPSGSPAATKVKSGPLKGISQALLDKVRNKQNARISREMVRKPESQKRLEMLNRLPEIVRILRTYFVLEKRAAILLEDVKVKICDSYHSPISPDDVESHLKVLCPIVPKWITYITIPRGVFVKIDKNVDLNNVIQAIQAEISKEKS